MNTDKRYMIMGLMIILLSSIGCINTLEPNTSNEQEKYQIVKTKDIYSGKMYGKNIDFIAKVNDIEQLKTSNILLACGDIKGTKAGEIIGDKILPDKDFDESLKDIGCGRKTFRTDSRYFVRVYYYPIIIYVNETKGDISDIEKFDVIEVKGFLDKEPIISKAYKTFGDKVPLIFADEIKIIEKDNEKDYSEMFIKE